MGASVNVDPAEIDCISLFSGAAGLDMGVELAGISRRVVAYVEREAYACEVLASRMEKGDMAPAPIWTDVSTFDGHPFRGLVGCVSGGFPCQDISVAGKQAGIEGQRSGLWKQFARIVSEVQPRLVVIENVAALRTNGLEVVLADLAALGFDAEWGTLRASDVGATHHRDRLFILAYHHSYGLGSGSATARVQGHQHTSRGHNVDGRGGEAVANAPSDGRGQGRAQSDAQGSAEPRESGETHVADSERGRRGQVRGQREPELASSQVSAPAEFGLEWPPGPDDAVAWRRVVESRPDLEPSVRRVADGLANRVDRLRLTGNGVVPRQAAEALIQLLRRT